MNDGNFARKCGVFCIVGAIIAFIWGILNTLNPNSAGMTATNDFVVLNPLLHRLEHASFALIVYPALFAGLLGFYLIGAIGRGIFGKILIGLAAIGALLAVLGSAIEVVLLQWEPADQMRELGFAFILLLISPILFTAAALIARNITAWKRFAPLITLGFLFAVAIIMVPLNLGAKFIPFVTGLGILSWAILGYAVYSEKDSAGEEIELDRLRDADEQTE